MSPAAQVLAAVCRLPSDFRGNTEWPGLSMTDLLRRSGYAKHRAEIGERDFVAYLKEMPSLIDDWVRLSQDQRCTSALCLLPPDQTEEDRWTVAEIPGEKRREFDSGYEAAGHYIKRYVDDIVADDTLLSRIRARLWLWRHMRT